VTVTLDWVKMTDLGFSMQFTALGMREGMSFELPRVDFPGTKPQQYRGATLTLARSGETTTGTFYLYQLVREGVIDQKVDVAVKLSLKQSAGDQDLSAFSFSMKGVPVSQRQPLGQQTYSVRYNGVELRLEHLQIAPQTTRAHLCAPLAGSGPDWVVKMASLQFLDRSGQPAGAEQPFERFTPSGSSPDMRCADLDFPLGSAQKGSVVNLNVQELDGVSAGGQTTTLSGRWDFYADLPQPAEAGAQAAALAPLAAETLGDLTATLHWAFADASRVALEVQFEGWKPEYALNMVIVKDPAGQEFGSGFPQPVAPDDPTRVMIHISPLNKDMLKMEQIAIAVDVPVYLKTDMDHPAASFHFDLTLPVYPGVTLEPKQTVSANGIEMTLVKVEMTASSTELVLCYQKPTHEGNSDWMLPAKTTLQTGAYTVGLAGYSLEYDQDYGYTKGELIPPGGIGRCVKIDIPLGHFNQSAPAAFTLTIPYLEKSAPEVILDADLQAANEKLKAEGIEMSLTTFSGTGGGGGGPVILRKPEGMDDQEVLQRFYDALGYYYYTGPWIFNLTINP
jgi:hypothetical protein